MYSYDYIPSYNEHQQYLYYQQQQQSPYIYYNTPQYYQPQQVSPIADVKSIWSSALFLPCLYPYLYEPFDYKPNQQQQQQAPQYISSDFNALYEYLINDDNKKPTTPQSTAIRRLNFDYKNNNNNDDEYLNNNVKTTTDSKNYDSTSLSSDDGYQSGSFDNFVENINKLQYENLAAVVASSKQEQRNSSTSPKPKFIAPRFEKKWLENQPTTSNCKVTSPVVLQAPIVIPKQSPKIVSPNKVYKKVQPQHQPSSSSYKRNNYNQQQHNSQNKYNNGSQQQQPVNYTKRCNKCSLNFIQCTCYVNNKTATLSPSNGTTNYNNNKFSRVSYQLKTRS
jgi:hypothetical protein